MLGAIEKIDVPVGKTFELHLSTNDGLFFLIYNK